MPRVFERSNGRRNIFLRAEQRSEDPNTIQSKVGSLGNSLEEPDGCSGRHTEPCRTKMWTGPVMSNERSVMSEAFGRIALWLAHHVSTEHAGSVLVWR